MKPDRLVYSNGAYIEDVPGAPEWQRLICPCRSGTPYKFKLNEMKRLQVVPEDESERTHLIATKRKGRIAEWRELYRAALLETDPQKLSALIAAAEPVMKQRLRELRTVTGKDSNERRELDEAILCLRTLRKEKT
jgi:hypothetical protein